MTPDALQTVVAWYRDEAVAKLGWAEQRGFGPTFGDGNLNVVWRGSGPGEVTVVDPARRGSQVTIYENNNRTFIEIWQHVPKS